MKRIITAIMCAACISAYGLMYDAHHRRYTVYWNLME